MSITRRAVRFQSSAISKGSAPATARTDFERSDKGFGQLDRLLCTVLVPLHGNLKHEPHINRGKKGKIERKGNYRKLKLGVLSFRNGRGEWLKCAGLYCGLTKVDQTTVLTMLITDNWCFCSVSTWVKHLHLHILLLFHNFTWILVFLYIFNLNFIF